MKPNSGLILDSFEPDLAGLRVTVLSTRVPPDLGGREDSVGSDSVIQRHLISVRPF